MSVDQIAVATAVTSAAVSALSLLLAWYRGSTARRPNLARALGGLTLVFAIAAIVAIGFARTGEGTTQPTEPRSLSADEYRLRLSRICEDHTRDAIRIERAEGKRPVFGIAVQLETKTTSRIRALRPPAALASDHRSVLALWGRRVNLLGHFWDRYRRERSDPAFNREFERGLQEVERLTRKLSARFAALHVTPECDLFS